MEAFLYPLRRQKIIISIAPMASSAQIDILVETSSSDEEEATPPLLSPAEQHYADNSRTMLSLATMSIGAVGEDGSPLLDPDGSPWNKVAKKQIKPGSDLLRAEIKRRWQCSKQESKEPATKNWEKSKLMKWLQEHPIAAADDITFLKHEVGIRKRTALLAARERDKETEQLLALDGAASSKNKYKSWNGRLPYLRLIHALVDHDNIKAAYVHRGDIPSGRMAVENRNTEEAKAASVWQMMADKWNDKSFAPATASEPGWHPHYTTSETISFEMVSEFLPPNAEKVKDRFESMMTVLKRTIPKWERSGQGDDGHHGDDDDNNPLNDRDDMDAILHDHESSDSDNENSKPGFGVLAGRSRFALSKIQDFFENQNSYVIYLWHMIAKHQLISSSMNMLADGVGSRSGARGIPSSISDRAQREDREDGSSVSRSLSSISSARKMRYDHGDDLSMSIREHASRLHDFAMAKKESARKQIEHATQKEKRKRFDTIQLEIGRLRAEKRQLLIQKCSLAPGPQHANMENVLSISIAEVEEEIINYNEQLNELNEVDMNTPQKSNRSPDNF